ncbi:HAD-like domain-containing protein [Aspergillus carlsbadensis]|nr:HAD-like domain-containing protein [Aspergillus carlsbadensis]
MFTTKNVVFDVVGTLVSYDTLITTLETRLGDRLRAEGVKPSLLANTWIEVAEREYTYLSMSGKYVPFVQCMAQLFYRVLHLADIPDPRDFATDEDVRALMGAYDQLTMRPGAAECIRKLRDAGFTVWALTAADLDGVAGLFAKAGVEMPRENLLSCDLYGVGKPDPLAYAPLLEQLSQGGAKPWFAAAHCWDVSAAQRKGFRGAYSLVLEKDKLPDLFGEIEVTADTLPEMADGIIAASE